MDKACPRKENPKIPKPTSASDVYLSKSKPSRKKKEKTYPKENKKTPQLSPSSSTARTHPLSSRRAPHAPLGHSVRPSSGHSRPPNPNVTRPPISRHPSLPPVVAATHCRRDAAEAGESATRRRVRVLQAMPPSPRPWPAPLPRHQAPEK
jgi:hypothetical protein